MWTLGGGRKEKGGKSWAIAAQGLDQRGPGPEGPDGSHDCAGLEETGQFTGFSEADWPILSHHR